MTGYTLDSTVGSWPYHVKFTHPGHIFTHLGFPECPCCLECAMVDVPYCSGMLLHSRMDVGKKQERNMTFRSLLINYRCYIFNTCLGTIQLTSGGVRGGGGYGFFPDILTLSEMDGPLLYYTHRCDGYCHLNKIRKSKLYFNEFLIHIYNCIILINRYKRDGIVAISVIKTYTCNLFI